MRENEFRKFLENAENIDSKDKAVQSRISRANIAEEIIGASLDSVVNDDYKMYKALMCIKADSRERNGNIQNALRWYYKFVNGKEFPTLISFKKRSINK